MNQMFIGQCRDKLTISLHIIDGHLLSPSDISNVKLLSKMKT